jgi:hypothetical protein
MPKTQLADIIVPAVFARAVIERSASLSQVRDCGALDQNPIYDGIAGQTPKKVDLPFFQDLSGSSEVLSDSGGLTAAKITETEDLACILRRGKAWGVNDLAKYMSGDDPLGRIADFVAAWWARDQQTTLLKILDGLFDNTTGALRTTHRNNIYSDVASPAAANKLNGASFVDTTKLLGDHSVNLEVCCMHGDVEASLRKNELIAYQRDSTGPRIIETFQGRRFFVDDNCPKVNGVNSPSYTTYFFGRGAFAYGESQQLPDNERTELWRDGLNSDTYLISRRHYLMHPKGVKFSGTPAAASASDTELGTGTNWAKVYSDKNIWIVACKHNV